MGALKYITQYVANFPPEIGTCHLEYELAKELGKSGFVVKVITMTPRKLLTPRDELNKKLYSNTNNKIFSIIRLGPQLSGKGSFFSKAWDYFISGIAVVPGIFLVRKSSAIIASSPPLTTACIACLHGKLFKIPVIIRIGDIHPDALVDLGVKENSLVIKVLRIMERFVYKSASHITVLTEEYSEFIQKKGVPKNIITVIPNWVSPDVIFHIQQPKEIVFKDFLMELHKKIVVYAGTLSYFQDLDTVLSAAKLLVDDSVVILIMGNGPLSFHLMQRKERENIRNVTMVSGQPRSVYLDVIHSADIALVPLGSLSHTPTLPSKTLELMALERPIIASCDPFSSLALFIQKTNAGLLVPSKDPQSLAAAINFLIHNEREGEAYGKNGRIFATNFATLSRAGLIYKTMLEKIILCRGL